MAAKTSAGGRGVGMAGCGRVVLCRANGRDGARRDVFVVHLTNNPDKFFSKGSNAGYSYSFTYDPRAADEWQFQFGRGDAERVVTQRVANINPK